jgi:hypothetical protein
MPISGFFMLYFFHSHSTLKLREEAR